MNIKSPNSEKHLPNIDTWLDVVGSKTIADDKPICILIISAPASIAIKINCAIYPIIAPTTIFNTIESAKESLITVTSGFTTLVRRIVKTKTKLSFTSDGISLRLKTGASLMNPKRRAKIKIPAAK